MRIRKLNHSIYQTEYHIVWGTRYRRKFLKSYVRKELIKGMYKILRKYPSWYIVNINTGDDHVHMLLEFPPKWSVSEVVRTFKVESSKYLRKQFKFVSRMYDGKDGIWSKGYFVSTVGLNEAQIQKYIDQQNSYDRGVDVSSEYS